MKPCKNLLTVCIFAQLGLIANYPAFTQSREPLVHELLEDSLFADALNLLAQLPLTDNEQVIFVQYYQLLIDLFSQGNTYFDIDSIQTQTLVGIANSCTRTATRAQAFLQLVLGMEFPLFWDQCIDTLSNAKMAGGNSGGGKEVQNDTVTSGTQTHGSSQSLHNNITVFPNPNAGTFTLSMTLADKRLPGSVYIYDKLGQVIYSRENLTKLPLYIDLKGISKGLYFIKVVNGGEMFLDKIIYQ